MWVISKSHLKLYFEMPGNEESQGPLEDWNTVTEKAEWATWADLRATFSTASHVGDCIVFNVGGNKWRLITRLRYKSHKVFILKIMTHDEYDRLDWKYECGCFVKPPTKHRNQRRRPKRKNN